MTSAPAHARAHRVIFIDLARTIAVLFMVQGHTLDALLAPAYRQGPLFRVWVFQRGLTSCTFLLLSGFAFSIATSRHWAAHRGLSWRAVRRVRRFALFVLLGYALHFPVSRFADLSAVTAERWRSFLAVDVLQLIGTTLIAVQLLVVAARTERRFTVTAFALCALVAVATPRAWAIDWTRWLPVGLASFLSPAWGSQFPLFPWAAFVLLGAGLGQVYGHWGAAPLRAFANRYLLGAGAAMLAAAAVGSQLPWQPFGPSDIWSSSPNQFLLRAGSVLLVLGAVAHLSRGMSRLPHVFVAVAQESLVIYFVHLCIVYGSIWADGLRQRLGTTLPPGRAALVVLTIITAMTILAWAWNWYKHAHPKRARLLSVVVGGWMVWELV